MDCEQKEEGGFGFFFFKQKTAYEIMPSLVGSEMCIRDREMREKGLSYREIARQYEIRGAHSVADWERIYLEEGPDGLFIERRDRGSKGWPPKKLKLEVEEDLLAEVQRLRVENAYLKKLNALVAERVRQEKKQK